MENLNKEQKQAVLSTSKQIMLIAGAGTGKTNTIVEKIIYLVKEKKVVEDTILSVTFTNKAVNEIKERLKNKLGYNNILVNTFHELARTILFSNDNFRKLKYETLTIINDDEKENILNGILERTEYHYFLNTYNISIKKLIQDFSLMKNDLYIKSNKKEYEDIVELIFNVYQFILLSKNLIELDDLILLAYELLQKDEALLKFYQTKFRYIFIDEYQDINKIQYQLIKLLISNNNILVVGDEDQSIYSWRGSNSKYFKQFTKEYKEAEIIKLEQNYRSTKEILDLADKFIKQNKDRIDKTLIAHRTNTIPKIYTNTDITNQVIYILDKIQNHKANYQYKQNAILIRNKNIEVLTTLKTKLVEHNIPYQIIGEYPLHKRKIIKDLISVLKFIVNKHNNQSIKRLTTNLNFGLGKTFYIYLDDIRKNLGIYSYYDIIVNHTDYKLLSRYKNKINKFLEMFENYDIQKAFDDLINQVIDDLFNETSHLDYGYLQEFLKEARAYYNKNGYKQINEYLDYIEYFKEQTTKDKIQIMTMHASKGLEFNNIYILNLAENYPFLYKANYMQLDKLELQNNEIIEEERRLLYVSMTRAKDNLYILGHQNSRFIKELKNLQHLIKARKKF